MPLRQNTCAHYASLYLIVRHHALHRRDLEELRKRLARMCDRPDLRQQFLALDDVVATVQQALRTQSAPGITNDLANNGDGVPGFVPTDSITIQVAASIARIGMWVRDFATHSTQRNS